MTVDPNLTPRDKTPYIESSALKKKLEGVTVTASSYPAGRAVPVSFVKPDMELKSASFPGIYLSYADTSRASDREHRGPAKFGYAPPGYPTDVQVPVDMDDKDSTATESWEETFEMAKSPYVSHETPIPYNLDFNITVLTRDYQQMFEIIAQLDEIERIPARFGGLEVPEDGTIRTLDLLGGPQTSAIKDEDGKRLLQSVYSVRVAAEINLYDVAEVNRAVAVELDLTTFTQYL